VLVCPIFNSFYLNQASLTLAAKNNDIMNSYMVTVALPEEIDQHFLSLIPQQRAIVHELMMKGTIMGYALAADRTTLWITMLARSVSEVRKMIKQFPIYPHIQATVSELAFHEHIAFQLPEMSLN
jgi:hypothetical protein